MTYDEACRDAATRQGLDPICDALRAAGIPHWLDQTGGFCMVVTVPLDEGSGHVLSMVDGPSYGGPEGSAAVGEYWGCESHQEGLTEWQGDQLRDGSGRIPDTGPAREAWDALQAAEIHPYGDLAQVIRDAVRAGRACPYRGEVWHDA